jgi:transcriptional regulator with XRE-family HTH domain
VTPSAPDRIRQARALAGVDQSILAKHMYVSRRTVSRWENGHSPTPKQAARLVALFDGLISPDVHRALAQELGIARAADAVPDAPAVTEDARPALDAVLLAAAESRDVLPRHLRAFAIEMFDAADRLGLSARQASHLLAQGAPKPPESGM